MKPYFSSRAIFHLVALSGAAALILSACQTGKKTAAAPPPAGAPPASAKATVPAAAASTPNPQFFGRPSGKSGTQLWAENCTRCHNNRSPAAYSDAQWEVAMHHMRIRANLTAEEHNKILEFLQSAN